MKSFDVHMLINDINNKKYIENMNRCDIMTSLLLNNYKLSLYLINKTFNYD